jgi:hypothetical protein
MAYVRILILHAPDDTTFASHLCTRLWRLGGEPLLLAQLQGPGDQVERINHALQACDAVILVLSPPALTSPWIQQLFDASITRSNKRLLHALLLIMAQSCIPNEIPPLWTNYHLLDATQDSEQAMLAAARDLRLPLPRTTIPHYPRLTIAAIVGVVCTVVGLVGIQIAAPPGQSPDSILSGAVGVIGGILFNVGVVTLLVLCILVVREGFRRKQWVWMSLTLVGNFFSLFLFGSLVYSLFGPTKVRRRTATMSPSHWAHLPD